jgi:hypothetical protein
MLFIEKKDREYLGLFVLIVLFIVLAVSWLYSALVRPSAADRYTAINPSHFARVEVDPGRYSELISDLDALLLPLGMHKVDEPHPISKALGRKVLFIYYRGPDHLWPLVAVDDISRPGSVHIRLFSDRFSPSVKFEQALCAVRSISLRLEGSMIDSATEKTVPECLSVQH